MQVEGCQEAHSWLNVFYLGCTVSYNMTEGGFLSPLWVAEMMARVRRALWLVLGMLSLSLLVVVLGVYSTTRTESLNVTGYTSGVIVSCLFAPR